MLNSTLGSSLPSGAIPYIAREFNIRSAEQLTLPISLFLLGYVFGPIVCGPLSESYGRKPVVIVGFAAFMLFTLACALSQSWAALLAMRFFVGVSASAPIAVVGGVFADVYDEPRTRGRYMAFFMAVRAILAFILIKGKLTFAVNMCRPNCWSTCHRVHISSKLEMELLGRLDICWVDSSDRSLDARNICSYSSATKSPETAQGNR